MERQEENDEVIDAIMADKQDAALKEKSIEELQAMIEDEEVDD